MSSILKRSTGVYLIRILKAFLLMICVFLGIFLLSNINMLLPQTPMSSGVNTLSFSNYVTAMAASIKNYAHGDLGEIVYLGQQEIQIPIDQILRKLITNTIANLFFGVLGGIFLGVVGSFFAAWKPRIGTWIDKLHLVLLGVPDFFIVVLLQLGAIEIAKTVGHKVLTVMQVGDDIPTLIPFLAISTLPALLIYGTMRIAIAREWGAPYISTARSKGMSQNRILLIHILRNTLADLLAVLPKTITAGISSLVIAEVMSGIYGLGGYALNPSVIKVTSLPVTCAIFACVALFSYGIFTFSHQKFVIKHESGGFSERAQTYTVKDARNYRIAQGFLLFLAFVTVVGSHLMPHYITPDSQINFQKIVVNGVAKYASPPFPPNHEFLLGTDHRGYDLLSLLLNGSKYTLGFALSVTVLRFLISIPIGLLTGLTGKGTKFVSTMQLITSSVPTIIFAYSALYGLSYMTKSSPGSVNNQIFIGILFVVLVLLGIFQLAQQFSDRANYYSSSLFLLSARTMGASNRHMIFRHLLPLLQGEIFYAGIVEFVQVLILMGQLAVLEIFIGGGEVFAVAPGFNLALTTTGEWGGMIAYSARTVQYFPWIALATGFFYTAAIWILMFFSSQLQKRLAHQTKVRRKSVVWSKSFWVTAGVIGISVALLLVLPNKAYDVANPHKVIVTPTDPVAQYNVAAKARITKDVNSFMHSLQSGKWEDAYVYLDTPKPLPKPIPPFEQWMTDLTKKGFRYIGVKKINDPLNQYDPYQVELDVTDTTGQHVTWKLEDAIYGIVSGVK